MWSFKRKKGPSGIPEKLPFKSAQGFFEMQCKYGHTDLIKGNGVVAIVIDAKKEFGTQDAVKLQANGCQLATLRVAAEDGGFITFAETASAGGDRLKPDDLVVWLPGAHNPVLGERMGDPRASWIGLIVAKIAPEMSTTDNELTVICRY